ncbi:uncharacterized protein SPAPADRAFT_62791 [Spathaspora passalidarum NRRL Y-27907]|uniref:Uncharacterized protein n=1 Tax=Spathaspora passalidarum (strain NRRL Y-27907 / 11-Y1) TaxID=619300 RepID=G3ATC6_SPAPN|nr:uncharacterized protein SPAPADRAFT_62791 [Spathaspora passalidarum NRRL Y-27907]EGW30889.1 hypothetical protein SPAPADRAFT_62791 [Spathaspora passalidarum NRRL Y-27907]
MDNPATIAACAYHHELNKDVLLTIWVGCRSMQTQRIKNFWLNNTGNHPVYTFHRENIKFDRSD